uniref:ZU5 domain-containing protein n=1 Tax=Athene cunicularia TaxID=194338 RepID=A0A663MX10_ATHCN
MSYFDHRRFENKISAQVPASHHSDHIKPIYFQNQLNFTYYSKGKPAKSMDRPVGEKHHEPTPQVTSPPPTPSIHYTHSQLIVLPLPTHHKPSLSEVNSVGGALSTIETGVSIFIPQGAIPEGVEQETYFKVCRDNSILPPLDKEKGETLLTPLVMCGPHGLKFLKPVELCLPYCDPKTWQNKSLLGNPNDLVGANCLSPN